MFWSSLRRPEVRSFCQRHKGGISYRILDRFLDRYYGMETRKQVDPENYGFNAEDFSTYIPSDWIGLSAVLEVLPLREKEIFLDLGCGKGRALRIAARKKFQRIYGIELLPVVAEAAKKNLGGDSRIEVFCGDARQVPLPANISFVYAFNPFSWPVLREMLLRLHSYSADQPRPLRFLYHGPVFHELILKNTACRDISSAFLPADLHEEFRLYEIGS